MIVQEEAHIHIMLHKIEAKALADFLEDMIDESMGEENIHESVIEFKDFLNQFID